MSVATAAIGATQRPPQSWIIVRWLARMAALSESNRLSTMSNRALISPRSSSRVEARSTRAWGEARVDAGGEFVHAAVVPDLGHGLP